jgi:hypothetical protein
MVKNMVRLFALMLNLAIVICPLAQASADEARDKPVNATTAEPAAQPKIRVILPALWEPATPQTTPQAASPQHSAAR